MAARPDREAAPLEAISRREAEVLELVADHRTNAEIAAALYISERTVESHVSSLLRKTGAADRRALARHHQPAVPAPPSGLLPPALGMLADPDGFVGRSDERAVLRDRWRAASEGRTLTVVVSGEAGMGKSRIVAELAAEVHAGGGHVLLGACHEDADAPYGPFADAIADDAVPLDAASIERRAASAAAALAVLSPELERLLAPAASRHDRRAATDRADRAAIVDGIRHWLVATASVAPLLLVVEDLHWSTSSTRDALVHLVRRAGAAPLLLVVTTRDGPPDLGPEVAALLAELEAHPTVTRVALRGLAPADVAALLDTTVERAEAVHAETGGNPLLAARAEEGAAASLPAWLLRREQLLDGEVRDLLDLAAVIGVGFDADVLAAAHGTSLLGVLELLEQAEAAGLVVPRPGHRSEYAFVHALFRSHRQRALTPRRRLELHARIADALGRRSGDRDASDRARHACLAVPLVDARLAVGLAVDAGSRDERAHAHDEAIAHYRRAADAATAIVPRDAALERDLEVRLAAAAHHRGDPTGLPALLQAGRSAAAAGDTDALVAAALAIPHFGAVGFVDPLVEGRALTQAALDALDPAPSEARARLLVDLASHWLFVDVDEAIVMANEAESIARGLDDPVVLGAVLLAARHLHSYPGGLAERLRIADELEHLGARLDGLALTLAGIATRALADYERAELAAWRAGFARFADLLGDRTMPFFQIQTIVHRAHLAFLRGELDEAEAIAAESVPMSIGIGAGRVHYTATVSANRRLQGRDRELVDRVQRSASRSDDLWYRCSLAALHARAGDVAAARSMLDDVRAARYAIRRIYPWSASVSDLAEAADVVGDADVAHHVLDLLSPYAGRIGISGPNPGRPVDQVLAQASLAAGDHAAALRHAERAVEASRRRDTPGFLVRELVFLAEARRRAGSGAREVRPLVAEARRLADGLGAGAVHADAERYGLPG